MVEMALNKANSCFEISVFGMLKMCNGHVFEQSEIPMKKYSVVLTAMLLFVARVYGAVQTVSINNQSGMDITVHIDYVGHTGATHILSAGDTTPFHVEDKCLKGITVYSGRWATVNDLEYDDKLVIPVSWDRCQGWIFTITKRIDGTVRISRHAVIPGTKH